MADLTLVAIKAFAQRHFLDDFAKVPSIDGYIVQPNPCFGRIVMQIKSHDQVMLFLSSFLCYDEERLKTYEPFCWIRTSYASDGDSKLDAFVRFCYILNGCSGYTTYFRGDFLLQLKSACADIANGVRAKEATYDDPSRWGVNAACQFQIQQLLNRVQQLATTVNTLKAEADVSKTTTMNIEKQIEEYRTVTKAVKNDGCRDGMDWATQFLTSKVEVEELKAKLMNAQTEIAKLEKENMKLRQGPST